MKRLMMYICSFSFMLLALSNLYAGEAMQLLNKMSTAIHELDYQGELVYSQGNGFSLLRIEHSFDDGIEHERIINFDANGQQHTENEAGFSVNSFPQITPEMEKIYSFDIGGMTTVAGRTCQEVVARPKDRKRYLHRYCIDTENQMLLKYALVNKNHNVIEKMTFTSIQFAKPNIKDYIKDKVSAIKNRFKPFNLIKKSENKTNWKFNNLPRGFYIASVLVKEGTNGVHEMEQIILTDNVTSISLFIEPEDKHGVHFNNLDYGALNLIRLEKAEHNITIVGEVPKDTLIQIANGLHLK